jgi:hypothetical protein
LTSKVISWMRHGLAVLKAKGWSVHFCALDADCRKYGAASRLQFGTPWGSLTIAFRWRDRVQLWLPWKTRGPFGELSNNTRWWVPIAWHPRAKRTKPISQSIRKEHP